MKKWIFSVALFLTISLPNASIENMINHDHHHVPQKFQPNDRDYIPPYTVNTEVLSVKAMQVSGFSSDGLAKLENAFHVLETVVNTEEFKDRIINFKNSQGERKFGSNNGLSNEEIYRIFMEGRETLQMNTPGEMNFYLKLYNRPWSRVIGYTSGNTNVININLKYFRNFAPHQVASNLAHEWIHKLGFGHVSAKEHDSVPYALGYIVGDMAEKLAKANRLH